MGVIMRSEMHEEPIPPLKEAKREEDGEPTNNINEESDVEEETIVVKEKIYQKIKNSYTRFYEMRNTKDCPLKFVLSKERELLGYEKQVMAKKREYFHELLNSSLKDRKSGINNNDNKPKNKENRIK
ncbi:hypothetical protein CWI36_1161p0010 [Hamiltosporidium magnivora]|uniref:Uncharacterized protein n=1 Tax=Hamiltosporidium magnivora TaxID=148818 RepID=A0A4Q9L3W3_9MICR|nr:hypothetical protein CWI36_1161p0010 [Hamiltosporidium magnivora]